jgi:hypothetical protein
MRDIPRRFETHGDERMKSYELKLGRFQVVFSGIDDGDGSVSVELWKDGDLVEGREFDVAMPDKTTPTADQDARSHARAVEEHWQTLGQLALKTPDGTARDLLALAESLVGLALMNLGGAEVSLCAAIDLGGMLGGTIKEQILAASTQDEQEARNELEKLRTSVDRMIEESPFQSEARHA